MLIVLSNNITVVIALNLVGILKIFYFFCVPRSSRFKVRDALLDYLDVADGRVVDPVKVVRRADARGGCHRLERGIVEGDGAVTEPLGVKVLPCRILVQNYVNMTFHISNAVSIK